MKIIFAQYFEIFQISSSVFFISKYCAKMIFICSLIFLFLIKIRFPKGVSISEILKTWGHPCLNKGNHQQGAFGTHDTSLYFGHFKPLPWVKYFTFWEGLSCFWLTAVAKCGPFWHLFWGWSIFSRCRGQEAISVGFFLGFSFNVFRLFGEHSHFSNTPLFLYWQHRTHFIS